MSEVNFTKMRIKLNQFHSDIVKTKQYRGSRESEYLQWVANYVESEFNQLQSENKQLRELLKDITKQSAILIKKKDDQILELRTILKQLTQTGGEGIEL